MDQALIIPTLAALYEKLVADVAAQVVATMAEKPDDPEMRARRIAVRAIAVRAIASSVFEEKIGGALENYDCSDAVDAAVRDFDIEGKVEEAVSDIDIDSKVEDALDQVDLSDKIKDGLRGLRLELVTR
jgi:hypothetical protein